MDNSELPLKLDKALRAENYKDLKKNDRKKIARDNILGMIGCIPVIGAWVSATVGSGLSFSDVSLFRKIYAYIYEIKETTQEQRIKFFDEIEARVNDASGHVICDMINRLDNIYKAEVLANLTKAKINGEISIDEFFRLSAIVEKIPYTDFQYLPRFENAGYDDNGITDILYSSGALIIKTLDEDRNGYTLSSSGRKLLKYGLNHDVKQDVKNATTIPSLGWYDADDQIEQALDDKAMFDNDINRGK